MYIQADGLAWEYQVERGSVIRNDIHHFTGPLKNIIKFLKKSFVSCLSTFYWFPVASDRCNPPLNDGVKGGGQPARVVMMVCMK